MASKISCSERLRQGLSIRNMTQQDLCNATGIPKSAMSQYCNGAFVPKQNRTALIAKALNVSEAWLMGYDVPMERTTEEILRKTLGYSWWSPMRFWARINEDRPLFMHYFLQYWDGSAEDIKKTWNVSAETPDSASDDDFKRFILDTVKAVRFDPETPEWDITLKEKRPTRDGEHKKKNGITFADLEAIGVTWADVDGIAWADVESAPENSQRLAAAFDRMNAVGQREAIQRAEEMAELPKYQRQEDTEQ